MSLRRQVTGLGLRRALRLIRMQHAARNRAAELRTTPHRALGVETLENRILFTFDPSPAEQQLLELVNRFRAAPTAELGLLTSSLGTPAHSSDTDINNNLVGFNVNGPALQTAFSTLVAAPPLAWSETLSGISLAHNQSMITNNIQSHQTVDEPDFRTRFNNGGYDSNTFIGENIFSASRSVIMGHAGWVIDWGSGPNGVQDPAGHRDNLLSANFTEFGGSIVSTPVQSHVGPLAMTEDFGSAAGPTLLGVAYADANNNGFYDAGEGVAGMNVEIKGVGGTTGDFNVTSMTAGGYQKALAAGTYDVTFSGSTLTSPVVVHNVVIGTDNVKVDEVLIPVPVIEISGANHLVANDVNAVPTLVNDTDFETPIVNGVGHPHTFTIINAGTGRLNLTGTPRVAISGANASDFTVTTQPAAQVAVGASTQFVITFRPSAVGVRNAVVTITNDDGTNGTYQFKIDGVGIAPTIQVEAAGQDAAGAAQTFIFTNGDTTPSMNDRTDFGFLGVSTTGTGITSSTRSYTIRNTGTSLLTLTSATRVKISGSNAADFKVTTDPALATSVNGTTNFVITFNPTGAGLRTATVTILSDDPLKPSFTFKIQGHGIVTSTTNDNLQAAISTTEVTVAKLTVTPALTAITPGSPIVCTVTGVATTAGTITGVHIFYDGDRDGIPDKDLGAATLTNGNFVLNVNAPAEFTSAGQFLAQATDSLANASHYRSSVSASAVDPGVVPGYSLKVNYTGYLSTGATFDSSYRAGHTPFSFVLGTGSVIHGWDEGLVGMKVGETRILVIPAAIAYGASPPSGSGIPANAPLIFEVTLVSFDPPAADLKGNGTSIPSGDTTPILADGTDFGSIDISASAYSSSISFTGATKPTNVTAPGNVLNYTVGTGVGTLALGAGTTTTTLTVTIATSASAVNLPFTLAPDANFAATPTTSTTGATITFNAATGLGTLTIPANTTTAALKIDVQYGNTNSFTIANAKSGTQLGFANFVVAGDNPADFTLTRPTGSSTAFTIKFKPTAGGLRKAVVTFDTNDPRHRHYSFTVQGNGPTMSVAATDADATEPGGAGDTGTFTITSNTTLNTSRAVNFKLSGLALPGIDYSLTATGGVITALDTVHKTGTLTLNAGVASATIKVTPINDTIVEPLEPVILTLVAGDSYAVTSTAANASATVNIADDSPTATVVANDAAAAEIGQATGQFTLTLTGDTSVARVLNFVLSGTASLSDYSLSAVGGTLSAIDPKTRSGTFTFNAATSSGVITVTPLADTLFEGDETVILTLVANTQVRLSGDAGATAATITIADGNPDLLMVLAKPAFLETAGANGTLCTITRTGLITDALTVNLASSNTGKATVPATVTFLPGKRTATFIISAVDNATVDGPQDVVITASDPLAVYNDGTVHATVLDDEKTTVTIAGIGNNDASENAADELEDLASFRITRADVTNAPLSVTLSATGLAKLGVDYVLTNLLGAVVENLTVVIPANQDHVDIVVHAVDDTLVEGDEGMTFGIVAGVGYNPGVAASVSGVIHDNENTVAIAAVTGQETAIESGQTATFRVSRTGSTASSLTVFYKVTGTAKAGSDYVSIGKAVTIAAGQSFVDVVINPLTDAIVEPNETINVTLLPAKLVQYNIDGTSAAATVNLQDAVNPGGVDLIALSQTHKATTYKLSAALPKLTVSGVIKNQGTNDATSGFTVKAVLSKDGSFSGDDILLGTKDILAIAAGKTAKLSMTVDPATLSIAGADIGQYYLLLVVDSGNSVAEINEDNNLYVSTVSDILIIA